ARSPRRAGLWLRRSELDSHVLQHGPHVYWTFLGLPRWPTGATACPAFLRSNVHCLFDSFAFLSKSARHALPASDQRPFVGHVLPADAELRAARLAAALCNLWHRHLCHGHHRFHQHRHTAGRLVYGTLVVALDLLAKRFHDTADDALRLSGNPASASEAGAEAGDKLARFSLRFAGPESVLRRAGSGRTFGLAQFRRDCRLAGDGNLPTRRGGRAQVV